MPKNKVKLLTPPSSDNSDQEEDLVPKKVVNDTDSEGAPASDSDGEEGEEELSANYGMEAGEDEMDESIENENTPKNSEDEEEDPDAEIDYN
jgi:hypothetical protein